MSFKAVFGLTGLGMVGVWLRGRRRPQSDNLPPIGMFYKRSPAYQQVVSVPGGRHRIDEPSPAYQASMFVHDPHLGI